MARPIKEGLDYFPHDVDAADDEKIQALSAMHGNDGYAFYFKLLERIYRTPSGELDLSNVAIKISLASRVFPGENSENALKKFEKILDAALVLDCFDKKIFRKTRILTSNGIKKRVNEILKIRSTWRNKKEKAASFSQGKTSQETRGKTASFSPGKTGGKTQQETQGKTPQSIILKNKAYIKDKDKEFPPTPQNGGCDFPEPFKSHPRFQKAWADWESHRTEKRNKLTPSTIKRQLKFLAPFGVETAIEIIEKSITNGWTGLFEPKEGANDANRTKGERDNDSHQPDGSGKFSEGKRIILS